MAQSVDGISLGMIAAGGTLIYAGIKGKSLPSLVQSFVTGKSPSQAATANPVSTTTASAGVTGTLPSSSNAQQALQQAATSMGWGSGAQWQALQNVEMAEAGFNPNATNPASGAYGLAQALGHGQGTATQGTVANEYGGYGLTDAQAKAANSGDAAAQALWMVNYIAATYGNPENAWAHEQSQGNY